MILSLLKLLFGIFIAFVMGKLVTQVKMPAILGWLITGMVLGPHGIQLMSNSLLETDGYLILLSIFETMVGLMIGTELVWETLKRMGKPILVTTIFESLLTFFVVTAFFGIIFYFTHHPFYLAFVFASIALATAPAPALSIVKEFKTKGPVTQALLPIAAMDDLVAILVFFTLTSLISAAHTTHNTSLAFILATMIGLPLVIGLMIGGLGGVFLKKERTQWMTFICVFSFILLIAGTGFLFNRVILSEPSINFIFVGMVFSATFANMISRERLHQIMKIFNPIISLSLLVVILNLGAPLDYSLVLGAGIFTVVYIVSRAIGKYSGAFLGAKLTGLSDSVTKYLGLTLLPHSGVSLVFTGIAVSSIVSFDPESAAILQGTIAAAAVINEIIAVILAKKAFEWAGELEEKN